MSLLIKGMDMPDSCSKCPLKYSNYDMYCCRVICGDGCIVCVDSYTKRRNPACPLVKIPTPHGRLIDADVLLAIMRKRLYGNPEFDYIIGLVERQRTIIEAEE